MDELPELRKSYAEEKARKPEDEEDRVFIETYTRATESFFEKHRLEMLRLGTVGRLELARKAVALPVEDLDAYLAANPVAKDGTVRFDPKAIEAREDAIARNLTQKDGLAIIVLGGAHDLTDNLRRIDGVEYIRISTKAYLEASGKSR